jgi:amino acid adenylation domain-containing protein
MTELLVLKEEIMPGRELTKKKTTAAGQNVRDRDYWLDKLSGEWEKSVFPYDHPISKRGVPDALESVSFRFQGECFSDLMQLSNESDHRLFMILFTQLVLLLYKYTGSKDIIVGAPIVKQEDEGDFINTVLALRNTFNADMTFKELLLRVRQTIIEAADHQNYPIEALVHKLSRPVTGDDFPLFDIAVLLENIHDKAYIRDIHTNMLFIFRHSDREVEGMLEYNPLLFAPSTVEGIINHYTHLVSRMMERMDRQLADIEMLSEEEKQQVLFDFNATGKDYPAGKTIHRLFEEQVERTPDRTAVVDPPPADGSSSRAPLKYTYRQLNEKANQLAGLLREKNVRPDTIVALLMESSIDRIAAVLGILKAGGAYLPIDTEYPENRVLSILDDCGASLLLTHSTALEKYSFTRLKNFHLFAVDPFTTPPRPPISDFDRLPFPDRGLIDYGKYRNTIGHAVVKGTISLQATRGCPYNCAFCHKIWPKKHTYRSAENLFAEVQRYYRQGVRKFSFVDDIFNLNVQNSSRFFQLIIKNGMNKDIQIFYPNGLRGDILKKEYIDLMVEAGTVSIGFALESASPRLQKMIGKNLDLEKLRSNFEYIAEKYPHIFLEIFTMIGFPTETEEEAMKTFDFIKSIRWVDFPYVFILKIFPNTDMEKLAIENGIPREAIVRSANFAFHQLPETLPFPASFVLQYQTRFTNEYFLSSERLLHKLPHQLKLCTEDELVQKYDNYLPMPIKSIDDIRKCSGISPGEMRNIEVRKDDGTGSLAFYREKELTIPRKEEGDDRLRVLLLDLSNFFTSESESMLYGQVIEPLGLMYLMTYLKEKFDNRVLGKVLKSRVDFDSYEALRDIITRFQPDVIGIRTLSYYKEFFHKVVSYIRNMGVTIPIISGGPYATSDYKFILQDPDVDVVVFGEGELTFTELVEAIMANGNQLPDPGVLKTIRGIAFMENKNKRLLVEKGREVLLLDHLSEEPKCRPVENPDHINQPQDLLYLISTSGSTGKPKSVMLEHRNLNNLLHFQSASSGIDFTHRVLQFASIGFDVSVQEIFSTLSVGGTLYLIDMDMKTDVHRLFDWIETNKISILFMPPSFLKLVFTEPEYTAMFPRSVKHIIAAGEQLVVPGAFRRYLKENRVYLHNHYGPSETHVVTTLTIDPAGEIPGLPSIGKPISNNRIYILDENRNPVPVGVLGELYIAGYNVGRGYFRKDALTREKFTNDPFLPGEVSSSLSPGNRANRMYGTGDLARWLKDGTIEFSGRKDDQVKIRGFRIELGEIENHLRAIDGIREAVVIDRAAGKSGQGKGETGTNDRYLCAYYVSDEEMAVSHLRDRLLEILPEYMMPTYFVHLDTIPLTASGKKDRKLLPDPEVKSREKYIAPRDEIEKKLVEIWSEVLDIPQTDIGIDSNFFELGGHSLKATVLITRIHKAFNVKTSLGEMFNQPFIRGLAQLIRESVMTSEKFISIKPTERKDYYPMSSSQKRMYIINQLEKESTSYNMPAALIIEGNLDKEKLEAVFQKLILRQESLRTRFVGVGGEAVQTVEPVDRAAFAIEYKKKTGDQVEDEIRGFVRPFDLSQAPLLRVGLVKLDKEKYLLMVDIHHIIGDGVSLGILVREFTQLYEGDAPPPMPIQYKDYAIWQKGLVQAGELEKQEAYWLDQLEGNIPVLNLPLDYPRPAMMSFEGKWIAFEIPGETTGKLRELAAQNDVTLYMVLLAVYNVLLHKYTGSETIVVGSAIAGRAYPDLDTIIGVFLNTLVLKNTPSGGQAFVEFLQQVGENTLRAFDNQEYQFEELVEKLDPKRDFSRNPIFDTMFNFHNMEIPEITIHDLKLTPCKVESTAVKFDIKLMAREYENRLRCTLDYGTRLFKEGTMERFIENYLKIIDKIIEDPAVKISGIQLMSEVKKKEIIEDFTQDIQHDF